MVQKRSGMEKNAGRLEMFMLYMTKITLMFKYSYLQDWKFIIDQDMENSQTASKIAINHQQILKRCSFRFWIVFDCVPTRSWQFSWTFWIVSLGPFKDDFHLMTDVQRRYGVPTPTFLTVCDFGPFLSVLKRWMLLHHQHSEMLAKSKNKFGSYLMKFSVVEHI